MNGSAHAAVSWGKERMGVFMKQFGNQHEIALFDDNGIFLNSFDTSTEICGDAILFSVEQNYTDNSGKMKTKQGNICYR